MCTLEVLKKLPSKEKINSLYNNMTKEALEHKLIKFRCNVMNIPVRLYMLDSLCYSESVGNLIQQYNTITCRETEKLPRLYCII